MLLFFTIRTANPPPIPAPARKIKMEKMRVENPELVLAATAVPTVEYAAVKPLGYLSLYAAAEVSAGTLMALIPIGPVSSLGAVPGAPQNPICSNHHLQDINCDRNEDID